jgi:hypothetical protein
MSLEATEGFGLYAFLDARLECPFLAEIDTNPQQFRKPKLKTNYVKYGKAAAAIKLDQQVNI